MIENLGIIYGIEIENVIGININDSLIGNEFSNCLEGLGG